MLAASPRPIDVRVRADGTPIRIEGRTIVSVRESWLVEDRWWTERPLRRRYWEIVTEAGANLVAFRDLATGAWYAQR